MKTNKRITGKMVFALADRGGCFAAPFSGRDWMVLIRIALVLAAVWFFCQGQAALASGWARVGGIQ